MPREGQLFIASGEGRIYSMAFEPDRAPAAAIVLCYPLFEERKSAARTMVEMARTLSADGFLALTFDYRGCGDSSGEFRDFSTPDWMADLTAAIDVAKQRAPGVPVGLLGLRLGAALALQAAAGRADVGFAALWEPVLNGRDYVEQELRKKLMKEMMTFGKGRQTRDSLLKTLEQGGEVDFDGYPITARLFKDLCQLDLTGAALRFKKRSLIVNVTSQDTPSKPIALLHEALRQAGADADVQVVNEQPFWNLIGIVNSPALVRTTREWLSKAAGSTGPR